MSDKEKNPCRFKRACNTCTMAFVSDRPSVCISMECDYYTPCKRCQNNRDLNDDKLCNVCVKELRTATEAKAAATPILELTSEGVVSETTADLKAATIYEDLPAEAAYTERRLSISRPGQPPSEYSEQEKEIYRAEWSEYQGYYRDPTSKFTLHTIIILQIELNWVLNEMTIRRGAIDKNLEQQRMRLVRSLKELRDQLPTKEANEESDDEKFLSMIYEKYAQEAGERRLGQVSRVLSPEAIALAPVLHFPINPQNLLMKLGYRMVDASEACSSILIDDLPRDPRYALEFFGFFLSEKYALPLNSSTASEEEEPLPAIANPAESATSQQAAPAIPNDNDEGEDAIVFGQ